VATAVLAIAGLCALGLQGGLLVLGREFATHAEARAGDAAVEERVGATISPLADKVDDLKKRSVRVEKRVDDIYKLLIKR